MDGNINEVFEMAQKKMIHDTDLEVAMKLARCQSEETISGAVMIVLADEVELMTKAMSNQKRRAEAWKNAAYDIVEILKPMNIEMPINMLAFIHNLMNKTARENENEKNAKPDQG